MFDVGLLELAVIALVAVVVMGPDKLPELARQAARMVREVRTLGHAARDGLRDQLGPGYADLELRDLDPRAIVRRHIVEAMEDVEAHAPQPGQQPLSGGEPPPYDAEAT